MIRFLTFDLHFVRFQTQPILYNSVEPETLHTCAQFFLEHQQYSKAVDLLLLAKKYLEALDICIDKHISITEDLAEQISPEKDAEPEYK